MQDDLPTPQPGYVPPRQPKRFPFVLVIAGVVGMMGLGLFLYYQTLQPTRVTPKSDESSTVDQQKQYIALALERFETPTTGEMWFAEPRPVESQGYLKTESYEYFSRYESDRAKIEQQLENFKPTYYEVGMRDDNKIIAVRDNPAQPKKITRLFEKAPNDRVSLILKPQKGFKYDETQLRYDQEIITDKVSTVDEETAYDSLSPPDYFELKNGEKLHVRKYATLGSFDVDRGKTTQQTKIEQLGANTIFMNERSYPELESTNVGYMLRTPLGLDIELDYTPNQLSLEGYSWDSTYSGTSSLGALDSYKRWCAAGHEVTRADALTMSDLKAVGKTNAGRSVYQPKSTNTLLMKKAYDIYVQQRRDTSQYAQPYDEYVARLGLVIIPNNDNQLLVYLREEFIPPDSCE